MVVGIGAGTDEVGVSGELAEVLDTGTEEVVTGLSGVVSGGGIIEVSGVLDVAGVETGGMHWVQTVEVDVMKIVEIVDVVSIEVVEPLVTVFVTGQVVNVV